MNYRWPTVVIAALAAGMVAAIVAPRFTEEGGFSWLAFSVVAIVAGAAAAFATRQRVDDGATVRDDALPPE